MDATSPIKRSCFRQASNFWSVEILVQCPFAAVHSQQSSNHGNFAINGNGRSIKSQGASSLFSSYLGSCCSRAQCAAPDVSSPQKKLCLLHRGAEGSSWASQQWPALGGRERSSLRMLSYAKKLLKQFQTAVPPCPRARHRPQSSGSPSCHRPSAWRHLSQGLQFCSACQE